VAQFLAASKYDLPPPPDYLARAAALSLEKPGNPKSLQRPPAGPVPSKLIKASQTKMSVAGGANENASRSDETTKKEAA
jgi:hypothetical protein